jgi:hypothetical protein
LINNARIAPEASEVTHIPVHGKDCVCKLCADAAASTASLLPHSTEQIHGEEDARHAPRAISLRTQMRGRVQVCKQRRVASRVIGSGGGSHSSRDYPLYGREDAVVLRVQLGVYRFEGFVSCFIKLTRQRSALNHGHEPAAEDAFQRRVCGLNVFLERAQLRMKTRGVMYEGLKLYVGLTVRCTWGPIRAAVSKTEESEAATEAVSMASVRKVDM